MELEYFVILPAIITNMDTTAQLRSCLYCSKELKGRKDKKFCNDGCRNTFHNELNSPTNDIVNPIFNILKKNRAIILDLLSKNNPFATREELLQAGFNFAYTTEHTLINNQYYFFYFDVGIDDSFEAVYHLVYRKEFLKLPFSE